MTEQLRLVLSPDGRLHEVAEPAPRVARAPAVAPPAEAAPDPQLVADNRTRIGELKHLPYGHVPPARPAVPVTPAPARRRRLRRRPRYDAFGREIHPRGARRDPFGRVNPSWPHGYR